MEELLSYYLKPIKKKTKEKSIGTFLDFNIVGFYFKAHLEFTYYLPIYLTSISLNIHNCHTAEQITRYRINKIPINQLKSEYTYLPIEV